MAAEAMEGEIEELSSRIQSYPRDLLRRFGGTRGEDESPGDAGGDMGEVGLSLGLSLGGCFGVEPKETRLVRSSSISTLSMLPIEHDFSPAPPLARTCSLPTETEEERRKRKEMQCLKRLEAKRKRTEKRNFNKFGGKDRKEENLDEDMDGGQGLASASPVAPTVSKAELGGGPGLPPQLPRWGMGPGGRPVDASRYQGPISQGSIGSQGSSSSGVSDFESRPVQGFDVSGLSNSAEAKSPSTTNPSVADHANHKSASTPLVPMARKPLNSYREEDNRLKKADRPVNGTREMERNMMEEMPCVSTQGDGPNGRRIEGFLYKYRKGEEVRIVCVCHGSFLTPAEFVKHAGGGDVTHPLRHIVVNPTPSAFL